MALSTEKVLGRKIKTSRLLISMLEITSLTRNTDLESSFGHLATFTRETIETMREKVTERCTLQIRQCTRVIGKEVFRLGMQL